VEVCENVYGDELDWFFEQWIYDEYFPIYQGNMKQDYGTFDAVLEIDQVQGSYGCRKCFEMPVEIFVRFRDGSDTLFVVWNDKQEQSFNLQFDKKILDYQLDPNKWILSKGSTVSIEDFNSVSKDRLNPVISPNPASDIARIGFYQKLPSAVKLSIVDLVGREMFKAEKFCSKGYQYLEVDVSIFDEGCYFVRVESNLEKCYIKMLISR